MLSRFCTSSLLEIVLIPMASFPVAKREARFAIAVFGQSCPSPVSELIAGIRSRDESAESHLTDPGLTAVVQDL